MPVGPRDGGTEEDRGDDPEIELKDQSGATVSDGGEHTAREAESQGGAEARDAEKVPLGLRCLGAIHHRIQPKLL